jgi:hypothetical protein
MILKETFFHSGTGLMLQLGNYFLTIPLFTYNRHITFIVADSVDRYLDKDMSQVFQLKMQRDHFQQIHVLHIEDVSYPKKLCVFVTDMFGISSNHLEKQNIANKMHSRLSLSSPQNFLKPNNQYSRYTF